MESRVFKIFIVQMIIGMAFMANHWAVYTTVVLTLIHIFLPQVTAMIIVYGLIKPFLFILRVINPLLEARVVNKLEDLYFNMILSEN